MNVKVRFPPSPTGYCHVGTARMALVNYLFARKHGGHIVFRIEDTDKERSTKEFEADIVDSIQWLGLDWDEFYRQSERTPIYADAVTTLIDAGKAYVSEEESKKTPGAKVQIVRLRNPGTIVAFDDVVRGRITFDTTELGDFAIARAIDDPLYHLTVVVDDALMGITHVIRGEEHISNTPRQILIQEALGYARPIYAHYPLFLDAERAKLSKRKGDVAVRDYRRRGFLPQALLNYIGILGWTPPTENELLTLDEMVAMFDLKDLHKSGGVFDVEKLRWFNREYLLKMRDDDFDAAAIERLHGAMASRAVPWNETTARNLIPLIKERISVWEDVDELAGAGEFDYFFADPMLDAAEIPQKNIPPADTKKHLEEVARIVHGLPDADATDPAKIKNAIWPYAEAQGRGAVLWPMRYALSGRAKSPDPFVIASVIGKEAVVRRLAAAAAALPQTTQ